MGRLAAARVFPYLPFQVLRKASQPAFDEDL